MTRALTAFFALLLALSPLSFTPVRAEENSSLLIYCGITMVRPITELARAFEKREGLKPNAIKIAQGGSEELYQSAKKSRVGDIYFPGEPSYRDKHQPEGLLGHYKLVGYNQMSLFVQKGNPKKVRPDLKELLRRDLVLTLGSPESGSVGQEAKQILERQKLYDAVIDKAAFLAPDSRILTQILRRGEADIALNWRATAFFPDNAPYMDVVDLDTKVAEPQALLLIQLTFSQNPQMARSFIDFVAAPEGQAVFRRFGFLDNTGKH